MAMIWILSVSVVALFIAGNVLILITIPARRLMLALLLLGVWSLLCVPFVVAIHQLQLQHVPLPAESEPLPLPEPLPPDYWPLPEKPENYVPLPAKE